MIWSRGTGHNGIHGGVEVCTVIKTKFSCTDGLSYFLTHGAPRAHLWCEQISKEFCFKMRVVGLINIYTVEPRFNEVPRDWGNWFVLLRVCYIENLNITNLQKNNQDVRYIEV